MLVAIPGPAATLTMKSAMARPLGSAIMTAAGVAVADLVWIVAGAAQAASRKFQVKNHSSQPLVLKDVHQEPCRKGDPRCAKTPMYPMEFEGRPEIGAERQTSAARRLRRAAPRSP